MKRIVLILILCISFLSQICFAQEVTLIDFGAVATPGNWNNITAIAAGTTAALNNSAGTSTGNTLTITSAFGAPSSTGTASPTAPASTIFPSTATQDFFYCSVNAVFTLTGLDVNKTYTFDVFASRAGINPVDNRETKYTAVGLTSGNASLDATNNTGNFVTISNILPDATGKITFTVSKGTNNTNTSNYFYLNAIRMTEIAPVIQPTSSYTYTLADKSVTFTNTSTNATSYSWDFGDGTTSTEISPVHTYTNYGSYSVVLTSTNSNGSVNSTQNINVAAPAQPTANYTYVANGLSLTFTNTSTNATSYSWDFGDGTATSTSTSPSHTFASVGSYTVVLTATNSEGSNQKSSLIVVAVVAPASESILLDFGGTSTPTGNWNNIQAFSSATPITLVNDQGVTSAISLSINKVFGGLNYAGTTSPTGNAATIFSASSGNATSDSFFTSGNTTTSGFVLSGLDGTKVYSFDIFASRTPVSDNREAKYTFTGQNTAFATLDAANNTANVVTVSGIVPDATGKITLLMEKGANNTESTNGYIYLGAMRIISVNSSTPPTASYTYSVNGLTVTFTNTSTNASSYSWDFGDGSAVSTAVSPTHVYTTEGNHTVVLTATNANGSNTSSNSIDVVAGTLPTAAFTYSITDKNVAFTNGSSNATSYSWDFGDGSAASTAASPTYTYAAVGNYIVQLTATNTTGSITTSKSVSITALPSGGITKRILFLGNSYVFTTNPFNIPQILEKVANSAGDAVVQQMVVGSGWSLLNHVNNVPSLDAIRQGNWDFVSMNEYSHKSAFSPAIFATETFPYAKMLNDTINKYNPCGETILYQTWGYKQGDDTFCPNDPGVCTYELMDDRAQANYVSLGLSLDAIVNPVATVRRIIKNKYPNSNALTTFAPINPGELYIDIYGHPTAAGSYISACCFYTTMFRKDPTLITYDYPESTDGSLTPAIAADIRATVKSVIYDNLQNWYIGKYDLKADFSFTANGNDVTFTNTSKYATSYDWDFGDGTTSTAVNPSHTYSGSTVYSAKLVAHKCNVNGTITQSIDLTTTDFGQSNAQNSDIVCYPNPISDLLTLKVNECSINKIKVCNSIGKMISLIQQNDGKNITIDFSKAPSGIYFLSVETNGKIVSKIVTKN